MLILKKEGTDEIIEEILNIAQEKNVIVLHSCSRRKLGFNNKIKMGCNYDLVLGLAYTGKKGPKISIISIVNYQNFEKEFHELENLIKQKKNEYKNLITPELDK